jgi:hypothetical protein
MGMTNNQIADMLVRFVNGSAHAWEFDDFISSKQTGELDRLRRELTSISEIYPSDQDGQYCNAEGLLRIKEISEKIRYLRNEWIKSDD